MKANELMIGDFVFHEKYGNAIIETIDNDFGDNPSVKLISENIKHKDGYKYGYCWCDLNEIFSIPLTPEILEKNGFENGKLNISPQYYLEDKDVFIGVTLKDIPDKHKGIDIAKGRLYFQLDISRMEEPLYVHQLQHVLKLCGIDKTIEL